MEFLRYHQLNIMLILIGVCAVITILTYLTRSIGGRKKWTLICMDIGAMLLLVADRCAYLYRGDVSSVGFYMVRISNFLVFLLFLLILFPFNEYLVELFLSDGKIEKIPKRLGATRILILIGAVLLVVSQFTDFYYSFDAINRYQREPGFIVCYIIPLLIFFLQLSVIIQFRSYLNKKIVFSLLLFTILPLVSSIIQLFAYGISLTDMTMVGMVVVLYVIALSDMNERVEKAGRLEVELLKKQHGQIQDIFDQTIQAVAKAIDMKDHYSKGHSFRVAGYTAMLTRELGYDEDTVERYYNCAVLHDIGKIPVSEELLNKPGRLSAEEFEKIKSHTSEGFEILKDIYTLPELAQAAESHHERPDGKGYPNGLSQNDIPRVAQIIAVADTFDAMCSDRPYRSRMNFERAVEIIKDVRGTQLTDDVVDAFLRLVAKGEFRDPDDDGGGSLEDIHDIKNLI